jgi:hypothetical protein
VIEQQLNHIQTHIWFPWMIRIFNRILFETRHLFSKYVTTIWFCGIHLNKTCSGWETSITYNFNVFYYLLFLNIQKKKFVGFKRYNSFPGLIRSLTLSSIWIYSKRKAWNIMKGYINLITYFWISFLKCQTVYAFHIRISLLLSINSVKWPGATYQCIFCYFNEYIKLYI